MAKQQAKAGEKPNIFFLRHLRKYFLTNYSFVLKVFTRLVSIIYFLLLKRTNDCQLDQATAKSHAMKIL